MTISSDPMAEIRASFFVECDELLEALQDGLQVLDDGEDDEETINVVFRAVHSIKGGAGAFGLDALVRFAHRFETALDEVRSGRLVVDPTALKLFFQAADHLSDLVRLSRDGAAMPEDQTSALDAKLQALVGTADAEEDASETQIAFEPQALTFDFDDGLPPLEDESDQTETSASMTPAQVKPGATRYFISFRPFAELYETGNEPHQILRALGELGEITVRCHSDQIPVLDALASDAPYLSWSITLDTPVSESEVTNTFEFVEGLCQLEISTDAPGIEPETVIEEPAQIAAAPVVSAPEDAPAAAPKPSAGAAAAKSVVRVDLDRIERLVNLVGELVINQAMLSQSLEKTGLSPHSEAMNGLEEFQRLTRDIQDSVMMIRAQPVKSLFQRMSRIVREASSALSKDVRLRTDGEDTEVDKTVIERLADPLTHMVRNAVDHGLESAEERVAAGKPAQGQVRLSAAHKSGRVIIEVSDDGGGINRDRVRSIAIEKGLIPADAQLSESDVDNLLFLPGFSTVKEVSDLSGRGVGMDVVRTSIQSLGGRVTITSTPGTGTCFSISLPLTLAVLDGMVITVAEETLVVPLTLVTETLTLEDDSVRFLRPGHPVIRVRDDFLPLIDLGARLGYRDPLANFGDTVALLVTQEDGSSVAFVIDSILDQRQVVIKGLNDDLYRAPGVAAATILGDGQIALILDPTGVIEMTIPLPAAPPVLEGLSA